MKYTIRGQRFQVTDALRDYAERKLSRLEKYFEAPASETTVTMSVTKGQHVVEVTIPLKGLLLRAEDKSQDMYASIDVVVDKLERQIRKHKTKLNRKFRNSYGVRTVFKEEGNVATAVRVLDDEDELELVRTKRFTLKPMDVEEAILQMNMIGHNFFVFSNAESKEVNVVYRRSDGKYGLIEQD
ncbi:ribosome-associated translation inhibitor RaiA [Paenibacillus sp. NEAU-GSW1]|uniref:ribosome hibernation-promoting factor, HPF/YfiA family n=1 Tax=Paenibacillus sp. NEAU-GSW1 TaxID=2682486 RepID=UPI0012E2B74E|nr:ribosome-associated translation inhibitor RaiA [Paenibacillus sp. NEAU-GSW1]MUT64997.1 ribosome-associated translation inhibitor RaiA [Paenibacillus sp. NEAU-GSW1]